MDQKNKSQKNILVVDDTKANLRLLTEILNHQGYSVRPVSVGKRAVTAAQSKPPDLIILDIIMPEMDGFEVCNELKRDSRTCNIPIIFISAKTETPDKLKAFSMGGVDFITKPFQAEEVIARVKTHLALEDAQRRLRFRNQALVLLNKLSWQLESCQNELETFPLVAQTVQDLFDGSSGMLARFPENSEASEIIVQWGKPVPAPDLSFLDHSQPSLARINSNHISSSFDIPIDKEGMIYMPVRYKGTLFAALVFNLGDKSTFDQGQLDVLFPESKRMILSLLNEHFAMTLTNLRLRQTLRLESIRDQLTGFYNRKHMEAALERECHRARRKEHPMGITILDVDNFKKFNDQYGHLAGDLMLKKLSELIDLHVRKGDIACRYGGEEFLIILPEADLAITEKRAIELLEKVRLMEIPFYDDILKITVSIGISIYDDFQQNAQETVARAHKALGLAIQNGQNQVVFDS